MFWLGARKGTSLLMPKSRLTILVGNYGSGKTELSLNLSLMLAQEGKKVALVDLDIVNPYFRSRERADILVRHGVEPILPQGEYIMSEAPALPPEITGYLRNLDYQVVVDVGGDNTGATALGRFSEIIAAGSHELLMVVNAYRPDTDTPEKVVAMLSSIEEASGLKVTSLVNNTNLAWETDLSVVLQGQWLVEQVHQLTGLPIAFTAVESSLLEQARANLPGTIIVPVDIKMRLNWAQT
ncbi:hypothetical protein P6N53_02800 [Desulforamulus aquiferis]|uniref:CobQ/CobB/MinD/ParA nucleotide binding domain-containing protein n=2 Tax=Desulforamulus aquiferis TaxID=1397668 RepID=A0AAW7ZAM4_9FIRM|nr:hypothetical protein [Desulforamulus aquiferis]